MKNKLLIGVITFASFIHISKASLQPSPILYKIIPISTQESYESALAGEIIARYSDATLRSS
jgi:hypothetical protein